MREFDYKRAWAEVAKPAFDALPTEVRGLYERVCVEMAGVGQNRSLGLDWPEDGALKRWFDEIPAEVLREAQATIYFYGHWSPSGHSEKGGGGTWKFQILARQSLALRGVKATSTLKGWSAETDALPHWDPPKWQEVADRYMVETDPKVIELDKRRADALVALRAVIVAPYVVEKIDTVMLPHPFMITRQHLAKSESVYLDPRVAPCGICKEHYDKHEQQETVFVRIPVKLKQGDKVPADLSVMLNAALPIMAEYKLDGFAMPGPGQ